MVFHVFDAAVQEFELLLEFVDALEFVILTGETHPCDFVQVFEFGHHSFADFSGRDLSVELAVEFVVDLIDRCNQPFLWDFAFAAGGLDAPHDVFAAERLPRAVALDDGKAGGLFDAFVGGEAAGATEAFAAAADDAAGFAGAAVDDFVVIDVAIRAEHVGGWYRGRGRGFGGRVAGL